MRHASTNKPEGTVVVVEDEWVVRDLVVSELEECGFSVVDFETADAALPFLTRNGAGLDLVITDVQMPGALNGLQLAEAVGHLWPRLAVLVTSGGPLVDPGRLPPQARFLAKPWRPKDVVARVRRMLDAAHAA